MRKLIELREGLVALKARLGNVPSFRINCKNCLNNDSAREQLLSDCSTWPPPHPPPTPAPPPGPTDGE